MIDQVFTKLANGLRLTSEEKEQLKAFGRDTDLRNQFFGGNVTADGKLIIPTTFNSVYSQVVQSTAASIDVIIPSSMNHLFVFTSGRTDAAVVKTDIKIRVNGDTADNYIQDVITGEGSTLTGTIDDTIDYMMGGGLAGTSASAGKSESAVCFFGNIQSGFYKSASVLRSGLGTDSTYILTICASIWKSTEKIRKLTFLPASGNFTEGSIVSVYGVV